MNLYDAQVAQVAQLANARSQQDQMQNQWCGHQTELDSLRKALEQAKELLSEALSGSHYIFSTPEWRGWMNRTNKFLDTYLRDKKVAKEKARIESQMKKLQEELDELNGENK